MEPAYRSIFRNRRPEFGRDYGRGWIGFNHAESTMSAAIAHVERWNREHKVIVSHVFVVTSENACVEAAFPKGVVETPLDSGYFDDESRYVLFRKPVGLDQTMADLIVETAEAQLGADFDHNVLVNHAAQDNFLGWLINYPCGGSVRDAVDRMVNQDNAWICSELAAYCLNEQSSLSGKGLLDRPLGSLTPQELFEDDDLFEPMAD